MGNAAPALAGPPRAWRPRHAAIVFIGLILCPRARAADAHAGARVFKSQCGACHAATAGRNSVGPSLAGVVGRRAGDLPGFRYSAANRSAGFTWDEARLDSYLADPRAVLPGTAMLYAGLGDVGRRADLIAYLATLN